MIKPRIWAQALGTDPVLKHVERYPIPSGGERISEANVTSQFGEKSIGWLVRNRAGVIVFVTSTGSTRSLDQGKAMAALSSMEGSEVNQARRGHRRLTGEELQALLDEVGYSQSGFAREWGVSDRNVRRWCSGDLDVPLWVGKSLQIMATYGIPPIE